MILRLGIISLCIIGLSGCSETNTEGHTEMLASSSVQQIKTSPANASEFLMVCGVLFKVNNFDQWWSRYNQHARNLIISLRNEDDPDMVIVFEGNKDVNDAKNRANTIVTDVFGRNESLAGKPIVTLYKIKYFQPQANKKSHFLALTFTVKKSNEWEFLDDHRISKFSNRGLIPVGMGDSHENAKDKYLLLSVHESEKFQEQNNSPREIKSFLREMGLPDHTVLSYWERSE